MQPFDYLGLPSPDECIGILGLIVSVVAAIAGSLWLIQYDGGVWSFVVIALSGLLGWVSFMYCGAWNQSHPFGT